MVVFFGGSGGDGGGGGCGGFIVVVLWGCFGRVVPSDGFQVVFQGWCSGDVSVVLFVFVGVF